VASLRYNIYKGDYPLDAGIWDRVRWCARRKMHPFPAFMEAWKTISVFPGWSEPEDGTSYMWFDVPLEIEGVTEAGFVLHGGCYKDHPDCHVTFEIRVQKSVAGRKIPLSRLDWKSLSGGHTNPRKGESEWSGKRLANTHFHSFDLNWLPDERRMRGAALTLAMEINPPLVDFAAVRAYAGIVFKIANMKVVTIPTWQYSFL